MKYIKESLQDVYLDLGANPQTGLSDAQVADIQEKKGLNRFEEEKKETILQKIFHHATEFTMLILLFGTAVSLFMAIRSGTGEAHAKWIIIFSIVIISIALAIYQELGAEKALDALRNMNAPTTTVLRNGVQQTIDASELVPGDIVVLSTGDLIPADARLIESVNLRVDEAILTGESVPVEKDAGAIVCETATVGDRFNMLFSGCLITNGRALAVVTTTGMNTEMGRIASLLSNTKKVRTPLQDRLHRLGKILAIIAIASAVILFAFQLLIIGEADIDIVLLNAIGLAVAAVPEALPVIVTVALAFSVQNMAKKNAIIRRLAAVESLGSATVVCSDKTGTLTMNRMTIKRVWAQGFDPAAVEDGFNDAETNLLKKISLATNATIDTFNGEEVAIGDPTETAIVRLLIDKGMTKKSLEEDEPRIFEIPFDSDRKLMTTVHKTEGGKYVSITKGAFDRIPVNFTPDAAEKAQAVHDEFAQNALRVLSVATKTFDTKPEMTSEVLETDLNFLGIVGMIDPPRPESMEAVRQADEAGIRTVMITGDHAITAAAIAREIGILHEGEKAITGAELNDMSDEELTARVRDYSVYARVSPNDKIRIVQAWQAHDQVVAMTGDGVNDAPALKAADIGVAMGSGTDVSKHASEMILTDDNFSSIISAVKEGRRIYENLRKVLFFLLSANISEIFIMLLGVFIFWQTPLFVTQLLMINVLADGVPALFIYKEEAEADVMRKKPLKKGASVFSNGLGIRLGLMAGMFAVAGLVAYWIGYAMSLGGLNPSADIAMTMAYMVVGISSVVNIVNVKSNTVSFFKTGFRGNMALMWGAVFSIAALVATAIIGPVQGIFRTVDMSAWHWVITAVLSATPFFFGELLRFLTRKNVIKIV
ncbi:MAG: cation-translocating P-type ATPase [Oscillospiraceae bacterium]|nr:cation-translocating P-type ATPase [Oscillospiraceae bacterium]